MAQSDQEFLEYIVGTIVDKPESVEITRTVDERGVLLELTVDPDDMGKIIGKAGATAKAIRTLLRVLGAKQDARYNLKISEPDGQEAGSQSGTIEPQGNQQPNSELSSTEDIKAKAREGLEELDIEL